MKTFAQRSIPTLSNFASSDGLGSHLEGQIHAQYVRCGKDGCRCAQGDLHGPYYYRIWRDGIRIRKVYVKSEDVDSTKAACDTHKNYMDILRMHRQKRRKIESMIRHTWRKTQSMIQGG